MLLLCRCQLRQINHAFIKITTSIIGGRRWHGILRIRWIPSRYWRSLWLCPWFVNSHPTLHRTQRQSHKLLQYLVGINLICKIPCHRRPPIMEVEIFMDAWLMSLSWHWYNNNSMHQCYLRIITSCVTRMTLHQCLYFHLLFPTFNHCLNPPYHHWIVDNLVETDLTWIFNNKIHGK